MIIGGVLEVQVLVCKVLSRSFFDEDQVIDRVNQLSDFIRGSHSEYYFEMEMNLSMQ